MVNTVRKLQLLGKCRGAERLPDFQEGLSCLKVTNTEVKSFIIII
jgi:hypothetical protein